MGPFASLKGCFLGEQKVSMGSVTHFTSLDNFSLYLFFKTLKKTLFLEGGEGVLTELGTYCFLGSLKLIY